MKMTPEQYQEKLESRYLRFVALAEKNERESRALHDQAHNMASVIPFGQPILVGHYSERRDRNYREKIGNKFRASSAAYDRAVYYKERAESIHNNNAIFSDDPQAVEKLEDKIALLEKRQELMKAANKLVKKLDRVGLLALGFDDARIDRLFNPRFGRPGFQSFELSNNNAVIANAKKRLEIVSKKQATDDSEVILPSGIRVEYAPAENRIRIHFTARVPLEQFKTLRSHGYRAAPSQGKFTFSAFYNNNARYYAKQIIEQESGNG